MWDLDLGVVGVIGRIALAVLFGAIIGMERQRRGKAAGMRTLMLVGLGSAMFVVAGEEITQSTPGANRLSIAVPLIAAVIGGVGFLGAGTIIRNAGRVEGVTTAAAIWVTAGLGVTCGVWEFVLAAICGLAVLITLGIVRYTEGPPKTPQEKQDP